MRLGAMVRIPFKKSIASERLATGYTSTPSATEASSALATGTITVGSNQNYKFGGGTGTYWITATLPGVTEVQAGGGIFCDVHYRNDYGVPHEYALSILTTVVSRSAE